MKGPQVAVHLKRYTEAIQRLAEVSEKALALMLTGRKKWRKIISINHAKKNPGALLPGSTCRADGHELTVNSEYLAQSVISSVIKKFSRGLQEGNNVSHLFVIQVGCTDAKRFPLLISTSRDIGCAVDPMLFCSGSLQFTGVEAISIRQMICDIQEVDLLIRQWWAEVESV